MPANKRGTGKGVTSRKKIVPVRGNQVALKRPKKTVKDSEIPTKTEDVKTADPDQESLTPDSLESHADTESNHINTLLNIISTKDATEQLDGEGSRKFEEDFSQDGEDTVNEEEDDDDIFDDNNNENEGLTDDEHDDGHEDDHDDEHEYDHTASCGERISNLPPSSFSKFYKEIETFFHIADRDVNAGCVRARSEKTPPIFRREVDDKVEMDCLIKYIRGFVESLPCELVNLLVSRGYVYPLFMNADQRAGIMFDLCNVGDVMQGYEDSADFCNIVLLIILDVYTKCFDEDFNIFADDRDKEVPEGRVYTYTVDFPVDDERYDKAVVNYGSNYIKILDKDKLTICCVSFGWLTISDSIKYSCSAYEESFQKATDIIETSGEICRVPTFLIPALSSDTTMQDWNLVHLLRNLDHFSTNLFKIMTDINDSIARVAKVYINPHQVELFHVLKKPADDAPEVDIKLYDTMFDLIALKLRDFTIETAIIVGSNDNEYQNIPIDLSEDTCEASFNKLTEYVKNNEDEMKYIAVNDKKARNDKAAKEKIIADRHIKKKKTRGYGILC